MGKVPEGGIGFGSSQGEEPQPPGAGACLCMAGEGLQETEEVLHGAVADGGKVVF